MSHVYANDAIAESSEMLLPPSRLRPRSYRYESPMQSPSGMSSRRTSWSSDFTGGPFGTPFDDSRAPSRAGSEEDLNTQTVSEKFNILPSAGLLLFPEDVEKDDYLHNPDPNEKDRRDCDIFTRRGMVNIGGLAVLALGLLMLFIGYPILYVSIVCQIFSPYCTDMSLVPLLKMSQNRYGDHAQTTLCVYPASKTSRCSRIFGQASSTQTRPKRP